MRIGVTLDFYGTLAEIDQDTPTIAKLLSERGFPCSPEVERIWNSPGYDGQITHDPTRSSYEVWREAGLQNLARLCGAPEALVASLASDLVAADQTWTVRAAPGALELVRRLDHAAIPAAVLTNWDYPMARYLKMAGIRPDMPVISSAMIGVRKPHAGAFELARRLLNVAPAGHIHVGDDWNTDVAGAIRSGAWAVWVTDGDHAGGLPARILPVSHENAAEAVLGLARRLGHDA